MNPSKRKWLARLEEAAKAKVTVTEEKSVLKEEATPVAGPVVKAEEVVEPVPAAEEIVAPVISSKKKKS